jgi:predicted dehydrogenase
MGAWGRDWARLVIPEVREVELVACVDSDASALALLRDQTPIAKKRCFASLDAALNAFQADAVLNTTTLSGHVPITTAALDAGLHVLVEKPFTETLDCAQELVELAAARRLTLMVSQNYRFFPAVRTVARLVQEGALGDLHEVSIDFRRNDPAPPNPKRRHHADAHPLLVDMSIHHFDLLRLIVATAPIAVSCEAWNPTWSGYVGPPVGTASIRFEGDVMVTYRGSWISAAPETAWAGEWSMEFERGNLFWTSRGEDNMLQDQVTLSPRRGPAREIALPALRHIDRAGALAEFAASLRAAREPETSGRDNLGTIALMSAAVRSAEWGERVAVDGSSVPGGYPTAR